MTTKGLKLPVRIPVIFWDRAGQIMLDQMRAINRTRLIKFLGEVKS